MPITTKQLERRKTHLGASDMASLFGLNPWQTAYDLWLEKTGKLEEDDEISDAAELGKILEPAILDFAARELGPIRRNQYRSHPTLPIGANLDALLVETQEPVEAKTTGLRGPVPGFWGEAGSDQVPEQVIIQVHTQALAMAPVEVAGGHVAVWIGLRGLMMFHLRIHTNILDAIAERAEQFWTNNVLADIPPEGTPTISVAKLLKKTPGKIIEIDGEVVAKWIWAKDEFNAAKATKEYAAAAVLAELGDAEAGTYGTGGAAVTFFEQTRKGHFTRESTFRKLTHRPKGIPKP